MTNMTDSLIARGQEAVKSLAGNSGQAVRDHLFEAGRGLMAARQNFLADTEFGAWLRSSAYSNMSENERAALINLGEFEAEIECAVNLACRVRQKHKQRLAIQ